MTEPENSPQEPDAEATPLETAPPEPAPAEKTARQTEPANHIYTFVESITADTAMFGAAVEPGRTRPRRDTGKIPQDEIVESLTAFVRPDCYETAATALNEKRIAILHGSPGTGKRTAAMNLLSEDSHRKLVSLSPQATLGELAERKYGEHGYVIFDYSAEIDSGRADFDLGRLRDRLRAAKAYLVLTTVTEPTIRSGAFRPVAWTGPDPVHVVEAHLTVPPSENTRERLRTLLDGAASMRDLVDLAARLDEGASFDDAVEHLDLTAHAAVVDWFGKHPERRRIAEVTALAFARGSNLRGYETMLVSLEKHLGTHVPEPQSTETLPEMAFPQRRGELVQPDGLIVRERAASAAGPQTQIDFRCDAYQRHVLGVLTHLEDVSFWNAVSDWLDDVELATVRQKQLVADGLTALAEADFGEAAQVLKRWAAGSRGAAGQTTAAFVLLRMAYRDPLAPAALGLARDWITGADEARQWVAAMAFSSELGVRYPHEATRRLLWLALSVHGEGRDTTYLLGTLFANLVTAERNPNILLSALAEQAAQPESGFLARKGTRIGARTGLAVLEAVDVDGHSAVALYLQSFTDWTEFTRLMVNALNCQPLRIAIMRALMTAVSRLTDHTDEPAVLARRLGQTFAAAVSADAAKRLQAELTWVRAAQRRRPADDRVTAVLAALLDALTHTATSAGAHL